MSESDELSMLRSQLASLTDADDREVMAVKEIKIRKAKEAWEEFKASHQGGNPVVEHIVDDIPSIEALRDEDDRRKYLPYVEMIDGQMILHTFKGQTKRQAKLRSLGRDPNYAIDNLIILNVPGFISMETVIQGPYSKHNHTLYFVNGRKRIWSGLPEEFRALDREANNLLNATRRDYAYISLEDLSEERQAEAAELKLRIEKLEAQHESTATLATLRKFMGLGRWAKAALERIQRDPKGEELLTSQKLEDGSFLGFKLLYKDESGDLTSGYHSVHWTNNTLRADEVPTEKNSHGIYALKSPTDFNLNNYIREGTVLVALSLGGRVIESARGFRAEYATIIQILDEF